MSKPGIRFKTLDTFEDLSGWVSFASGQSKIVLSQDRNRNGSAMRLDFDFHGGGGFVVARKEFPLEIPESYSFSFYISGIAPKNIFEFKLVDDSNRNVWRYRVEEFEFSAEPRLFTIRNSQIEFAWGPQGGGPPRKTAAIEIVIAAGPGGRGSVWIDTLSFHDDTYRSTPLVSASSSLPGHDPQNVIDPSELSSWRSTISDAAERLLIDFREEREFGGLVIHWENGLRGSQFEVQVSQDGSGWTTSYSTTQGNSERSHIFLPHTRARFIRIDLRKSVEGRGFGIRFVDVKPHDFSRSVNRFFQNVAREYPAGFFPKYLLGTQSYWTLAGSARGDGQALLNEEGMVEVDKGSFSIAPFLYADGKLVTWADAALAQELMSGYLPIPSSVWRTDRFVLTITACAAAGQGGSILHIHYRVQNTAGVRRSIILFAAVLPFQVTPVWQNWRSFGGVAPIREMSFRSGAVLVNDQKSVIPLTLAAGFGAAPFAEGPIAESLASGRLPEGKEVRDEFGYCSGAIRFDLELEPGSAKEAVLAVPFGFSGEQEICSAAVDPGNLEKAVRYWESILGSVQLDLPEQARSIAEVLKTAAAHILINRDGPALHPGPRRYNRAWIRDGSIMGAALLRMGLPDPMRDFIRWYSKHQTGDGNIPDCVDREGTEWLPEFDAYGEFIYGVMEHYRFTGDRGFLEEMRPAVIKTLAFMEGLRSKRLTAEYSGPEKRAFYGILPESMSHEGYMAHPVHAFWDDFWALRGYEDGSALLGILGESAEAERFISVAKAFAEDLKASLKATIAMHKIDFVPGSVEFGDFDPTATSIAINLLDQLYFLPPEETVKTFDKYLAGFRERKSGAVDWNNYSAYEIRIIGALVRLGKREEAMELTRFMLADRRIPCWNQWPEISWRDASGPSFIGDLPHTWISGEYILAIRTMFAYEREEDHSLVIAAGVCEDWLAGGSAIRIENLPTHHGRLTYSLQKESGDTLLLKLQGDLRIPAGGIVVLPPLSRPILQVEVDGKRSEEFTPDSFVLRRCPAEAFVRTSR
ncbi:MAG: hypothetical protein C4576_00415 [Desulfobacteraceae bacterium]|nr:MAG: hypothetical protein C4576_00415 [Desulfobacteraceae bacterium]